MGALIEYPRHLLFSGPPVESQMPLYRWPHCVSVSKSLSSISLIRGEGTRVGPNWEVTWAATNRFDAIGPSEVFVFFAPCVDAKFESAIYLVAGAKDSFWRQQASLLSF